MTLPITHVPELLFLSLFQPQCHGITVLISQMTVGFRNQNSAIPVSLPGSDGFEINTQFDSSGDEASSKPERFSLKERALFGGLVVMKPKQDPEPRREAHQTVRLQIDTKNAAPSIRIGFTDQRLTAHGGLIVWSHFLRQKKFRQQLREVLPHDPTSPNAYDPTDVALGYVGGILCGADKLSRVAWLQSDAAVAEVLGVEAIASQSTLSRFFGVFTQKRCGVLGGLHARAADSLPSLREGYTLDLDSWALLHEDGHQAGVAVGYTRLGLKPCHRPLIAGLAEAKLVANYWLRSGNTACVNGAAEFLRQTVQALPPHLRVGLVRGDSGFGDASVQDTCPVAGLEVHFCGETDAESANPLPP